MKFGDVYETAPNLYLVRVVLMHLDEDHALVLSDEETGTARGWLVGQIVNGMGHAREGKDYRVVERVDRD